MLVFENGQSPALFSGDRRGTSLNWSFLRDVAYSGSIYDLFLSHFCRLPVSARFFEVRLPLWCGPL